MNLRSGLRGANTCVKMILKCVYFSTAQANTVNSSFNRPLEQD